MNVNPHWTVLPIFGVYHQISTQSIKMHIKLNYSFAIGVGNEHLWSTCYFEECSGQDSAPDSTSANLAFWLLAVTQEFQSAFSTCPVFTQVLPQHGSVLEAANLAQASQPPRPAGKLPTATKLTKIQFGKFFLTRRFLIVFKIIL